MAARTTRVSKNTGSDVSQLGLFKIWLSMHPEFSWLPSGGTRKSSWWPSFFFPESDFLCSNSEPAHLEEFLSLCLNFQVS